MAFDISTAKPIDSEPPQGFDLSTAEPVEPEDRNWYDPIRAALQGATFGFADEIGSAIAAAPASLVTGQPYGETYRDIHQSVAKEREQYKKGHPGEALALEVAGAIPVGLGAGLKTLGSKAVANVPKWATTAAIGAAEGGLYGAGAADPGETAGDATRGAVIGAVAAPAVGAVGSLTGKAAGAIKNASQVKREVGKLLQEGSTDKKIAKYMINGFGKVKKDPAAVEAIRQGFDEGIIATIKGSSKADRYSMKRMLSLMERGRQNALEGARKRSTDIIGNNLTKRIGIVSAARRKAGRELDGVARSLKGKIADFGQPVDDLVSGLKDYGVSLTRDANGTIKPDFADSIFRKNPAARRLISNVIDEVQKPVPVDGFRAHWIKKMIDDQVTFGKSKTGLGGDAERLIKSFRRSLDTVLDNNFPAYKQVNDIYADTSGVLDSIQKAAGKTIDIEGRNADKALGTLSRSLLSNIRSRANLVNSLDDLESAASRYGGKFDDDILSQVLFADELDRMFGAAAKTSLQGDVQKAAERAARSSLSAREVAGEAGISLAKKARGINEESAIKAMKKLLADGEPVKTTDIIPR